MISNTPLMNITLCVYASVVTLERVHSYKDLYAMKNITKSINGWLQTIHDKTTQVIYTIGLNRKLRKQKRLEKKLNTAIRKFNFTIKPQDHVDTLVVMNGRLIRIQFTIEGFIVRDDQTDEAITDALTILQAMERIKQ